MIDPTDLEKAGMEAALVPLGEYVAEIGMQRPFAELTKQEVLTLIEVVVTAYQDRLREGSAEAPF
jgi:predicted metalloendopeptidase